MIAQFKDIAGGLEPAGAVTIKENKFLHDRTASSSLAMIGQGFTNNLPYDGLIIASKRGTSEEITFDSGFPGCIAEGPQGSVRDKEARYMRVKRNDAGQLSWHIWGDWTQTVNLEFLGVICTDPNGEITDERPWLSLPRFLAGPQYGYEQIGQVSRGPAGQAYGRAVRQMRTFAASFARIKADTLDAYYGKAGTAEPHWIVPYPENITAFPPMWAVLTKPPEFTKRAENGWYWNVSLNWAEAY